MGQVLPFPRQRDLHRVCPQCGIRVPGLAHNLRLEIPLSLTGTMKTIWVHSITLAIECECGELILLESEFEPPS